MWLKSKHKKPHSVKPSTDNDGHIGATGGQSYGLGPLSQDLINAIKQVDAALASFQTTAVPSSDTLDVLSSLGSGDEYVDKAVSITRALRDAASVGYESSVETIRARFSELVSARQWRTFFDGSIFSLPARKVLGSRLSCFQEFGLAHVGAYSPLLRAFLETNVGLMKEIIDGIVISPVHIDMTAVEFRNGYQIGVLEDGSIPRATAVPLASRRVQTFVLPRLLVALSTLFVPPCLKKDHWKVVIVASGKRGASHGLEMICSQAVDLGMTTQVAHLGRSRFEPYVLFINEWKPTCVATVEAALERNFVVIVRHEAGVPTELRTHAKLRLHVVNIRSTDFPMCGEVGDTVLDALQMYEDNSDKPVPFAKPQDALHHRPAPHESQSVQVALLSEMLHARHGLRIEVGSMCTIESAVTAFGEYARIRGFSDCCSVEPEHVLSACDLVKRSYAERVTYMADMKTFLNLGSCAV